MQTDSKTEFYNRFYSTPEAVDGRFSKVWYRALAQLTDQWLPEHPASFLEVGCGTGFFASQIVNAGHTYEGVDISDTALETARKRRLGRASFANASAEALPFSDSTFDRVVCCEVLEHVDDPPQAVRELHRVLKPGGMLVASVPGYTNAFAIPFALAKAGLPWAKLYMRLQLTDRWTSYPWLRRLLRTSFSMVSAVGVRAHPPGLERLEQWRKTRWINTLVFALERRLGSTLPWVLAGSHVIVFAQPRLPAVLPTAVLARPLRKTQQPAEHDIESRRERL